MKRRHSLVWAMAVFVFLFTRMDIAYAITNTTTADNDHAASILTSNTHNVDGSGSILQTAGRNANAVYVNGANSSWTFGGNSSITTTGTGAVGILVSGASSWVSFLDYAEITTAGHGVHVRGNNSWVNFGQKADITTSGRSACGIYVSGNSSSVTLGDTATISTTGEYASGVDVIGSSSSITFMDDAAISTSNIFGFGAVASGLGSRVDFMGAATIGTADREGHAAFASGEGASINFNSIANIITKGYNAFGAVSLGLNSSINFKGNATISTDGEYSYGAIAQGRGSSISFASIADITTIGDNAVGAYISSTDSWMSFLGDAEIKTGGSSAHGIQVSGNSAWVRFDQTADITTTGSGAVGVLASGTNSWVNFLGDAKISAASHGVQVDGTDSAVVSFDQKADITTTNDNSVGVLASGNGSRASFLGDAEIKTGGSGAVGVSSSGPSSSVSFHSVAVIGTIGKDAHGVSSSGINSLVSFQDVAVIGTTGNGAHGVLSGGFGSSVSFGDALVITTTGDNAHGAYTINRYASIEFKSGVEIAVSGGSGAYTLYADQGTISSGLGGVYAISGDMAANTGTIDLEMLAGSFFTGATDSGNGVIALDMTSSLWDVTGNSTLTDLYLNSSVVDYSNTTMGTIITTDTLDGSGGTFIMKSDILNITADMLEITGTMNGSQHYITVLNDLDGDTNVATTGKEIVNLVDTADTTGSFQLTNNNGIIELGAWEYSLRQVSGGNYGGSLWQLYAPGWLTSTSGGAINTVSAGYLLSYADTQTLMQRLGDLRQTPAQSGFWFKAHGGSFEFKANGGAQPFDMDYWGVQLGYDRKLKTSWDGDLHAGIMFGYNDGDLDYTSGGSGSVDSKTLGVYGTFVRPDGFFVDLVLKYQWMDSDFDVLDSAGMRVTGNGASSSGFGASLELGKRILFAQKQQKSGWYVEPQVQLSLQRLGGGYFTASNGLHIGADNYTSLLGRIGLLAGYETEKSNFYVKVSKVKEFDGDVTALANGQPINITFDSSWWVYGLGYTSRINDKNSIYVDLERASGGLFTQTWALKAGWRMEF